MSIALTDKPSLTVVLPTKNRPVSLERALLSCIDQLQCVDEFLVIDQSERLHFSPSSPIRRQISARTRLTWIYDPTIKGLVAAKKFALSLVSADIVCFLEDDVEIEDSYFKSILSAFRTSPSILGVCGVVTNPPYGHLYALIHRFFHVGLFHDPRTLLAFSRYSKSPRLIPTDKMSGGLSAWRSLVLKKVPFRPELRLHFLEDIEYSLRVYDEFGACMVLSPEIRLKHYLSPERRLPSKQLFLQTLAEHLILFRSRTTTPLDQLSLLWLLFGYLCSSIYLTVRSRSLLPFISFCSGICQLKKEFVQI